MAAEPCEDYATSVALPDRAFAIVSDGCSSAGRTDLGSRCWTLAAEKVLGEFGTDALADIDTLIDTLLAEAGSHLKHLELDDGLATLGLLACDKSVATAVLFGDGVVAQRTRDDLLRVWDVSYSQNAPRYLQYERFPWMLESWSKQFFSNTVRVIMSEYDIRSGTPELVKLETRHTPAPDLRGVRIEIPNSARDSMGLFIMTDGATSFPHLQGGQAVLPLVQVPALPGRVVQTRLAALSRQWLLRPETGPRDDLAIGAILTP